MQQQANMPESRRIAVGEPYPDDIGNATEGSFIAWSDMYGLQIFSVFKDLQEVEVLGFSKGSFEVGAFRDEVEANKVSWLCFRVTLEQQGTKEEMVSVPWQECPICLGAIPAECRPKQKDLYEILETPDTRILAQAFLIDLDTRIVKAIRFFSLSPQLSQVLCEQQLQVIRENISRDSYEEQVKACMERYPMGLMGEHAQHKCISGD